ncbi:hypothetical protein QJS66_04985 [Kocuria rhizophila]|nr:hypothetical protein QJS66_04985 [Kocuria rhizophila]
MLRREELRELADSTVVLEDLLHRPVGSRGAGKMVLVGEMVIRSQG